MSFAGPPNPKVVSRLGMEQFKREYAAGSPHGVLERIALAIRQRDQMMVAPGHNVQSRRQNILKRQFLERRASIAHGHLDNHRRPWRHAFRTQFTANVEQDLVGPAQKSMYPQKPQGNGQREYSAAKGAECSQKKQQDERGKR